MAQKDKDQDIIKKMEAAYADFTYYMAQLEAQASDLVKKNLQQMNTEKISDVLKKIKSISKK
ncbi:MAG: hypothetical protein UT32_C0001G0111 [Parcubacteria group bacterium GW2011_GWC2_39_14]|nr:MAG: hypothetical protein UT32_C0001G0111 [Parcubacteria group bacterium GW2011_GWC2_39_14]KKR55535.1 MAG: hypothetical protein UT91_C0001G0110 [Parcubacteria group bacterium GW2011_GWA2_40_23]